MDKNKIRMGTSSLGRNNHNVQANCEFQYIYNNLPNTSNFSQSTRGNSIDQNSIIKDLQLNVSSLSVTYGIFNEMIHKFNAELTQVKKERDAMADEIAVLKNSIVGIHHSLGRQLHDNYTVVTEVQERYERSKNLLVFRIPDSKDETPELLNAVINDLLTALGFNYEFPLVQRLGTYYGQSRIVRLVFKSPDYVKMILRHKTKLRSSIRWQNVWIGEDRTVNQRLQTKSPNSQSLETMVINQI